ncbi:DUF736 domain-containing protein, partial [Rhizobium johnstonii]
MATTIATLTEKTDGTLEGVFATIRVNAPIALIPNANKASEEAPDYRIIHRKTGFEIGAAWNRISRQTGEEYISTKRPTALSKASSPPSGSMPRSPLSRT